MKNQYYYIVSGLPDISLESVKNIPDQKDFISDIKEIVQSSSDKTLLDNILLPRDNKRLGLVLKEMDTSDIPEGLFTTEEIKEEIKFPDRLPAYMKMVAEEIKENPESGREGIEERINTLFYNEMCSSENRFIRSWFSFERNVKNITTGIKARRFRKSGFQEDFIDPENSVIGDDEVALAVKRSSSPDFSLSGSFDYIEEIIGSVDLNPLDKEWKIDLIKWKYLDELTIFSYFGIETILAFAIKLGILNRWQRLTEERGREQLESIISKLESTFSISREL